MHTEIAKGSRYTGAHKSLIARVVQDTKGQGMHFSQTDTTKNLSPASSIKITTLIAWMLIAASIVYGIHLRVTTVTYTVVDHPIRADAADYYFYAKNLSEQSVYSKQRNNQIPLEPDALRSPGFPLFASWFYQDDIEGTVKNTIFAQTIVQIVCFLLLSITLIRLLGVPWSVPAITVLWTFPHLVNINVYYLTESLFSSLLALTVFVAAWKLKDGQLSKSACIVSGICIGLAALTRPTIEYFPIFVLLAVLITRRSQWKHAALFAGTALLFIISWKIRNLFATGSLSDPTLTINGLYHGSFPDFMYNKMPESFGFPYRFDPQADEVYKGIPATLNLIWERAIASPMEYLRWYLFDKQTYLWQWNIIAGQGDIFIYPVIKSPYFILPDMYYSREIHRYIHGTLIVIGLTTAIVSLFLSALGKIRISPIWVLLALFILYCMLIHIPAAGFPRYGIPYKAILIPLAIFGIQQFYLWGKRFWKQNH
jgi:4-amino-4-deoxy-L-arabinose transferase-like glycosyltransferase